MAPVHALRTWLATFALLPLLLTSPVRRAAPQEEARGTTRFVFLESSAIDLYFHARAPTAELALAELGPASDAARALDRALGGWMLGWAPLDGLLPGCTTMAEVKTAFARAPETVETSGGVPVALKETATVLADRLLTAEPAFQEPWKEHARRLAEVRARWDETVGSQERALIDFHLASLGMKDPAMELRVYLVCSAPRPGAVTVHDDHGRGVSFVAASAARGSQFLEIVLHEATHTLDLASDGRSVLDELRGRLQQSGMDADDPALGHLPHALMFVQAAESIRRVVAPAHVDYGESASVYARMGPAAAAVRGHWRDHLDGKTTRAEALAAIVASAQSAPR